ncbi:glycosylhydrolase family 61-5 [Apiospora arundinis]
MRSTFALVAALAVGEVASHATFQDLWVNGVDYGAQCARLPLSNSPVTDVSSNNIRCNANSGAVGRNLLLTRLPQQQQPGDRNCNAEAIGGAHYGPVQVYMSKVGDASTADGSAGWFKIFADTWAKGSGGSGDDDYWGTKDINTCCGRMDVKIPKDIANGDYLLRAEALALHTAGSSGQAQFYMTCFQLTVSGGGSATPATVNFPGAYKASDPGILVNIHAAMSGYTAPGPAVYSGGSTRKAGGACTGCESTCKPGGGPAGDFDSRPSALADSNTRWG